MSTPWVLGFIVVLIAIAIIGSLMRTFAITLFVLVFAYFLFHFGFVWNGSDVVSKLHLNNILSPTVTEHIQNGYNSFANKRSQYGVVNTSEISKVVDGSISHALALASNQASKVDKQALVKDLGKKLSGFNPKDVVTALNNMKSELAKYGITPSEVMNAGGSAK